MTSWLRRRKVAPLPIPATPLMIASALLDRAQQDNLENVVVLWKDKEGKFCTAHSNLTTTDILMHEKGMQELTLELYRS